jgi:hypothetical protein
MYIQNTVIVKRVIGFFIICSIIILICFLPITVYADNNEIEWEEHIVITGNCQDDNVRRHIQVNRTAVEIIVNLTWDVENGWADLNMWIEDTESNFANASSSTDMPEIMKVSEFKNRGRWTLVVVPYACGDGGAANFTANVTIRNIVLPEFKVSATKIYSREQVNMSIDSSYEQITHYFFDFGDDTDSDWINKSSISKVYEKSGEYLPKAKVRYIDGTESDWVEVGSIEVEQIRSDPDLLRIAVPYAIILAFLTIMTYFIFKKRKGV